MCLCGAALRLEGSFWKAAFVDAAHLIPSLWVIAGSLVRDVAALNKMEMPPWDVWGAQPSSGQSLSNEQLTFFDHFAEITREPDASFEDLLALYAKDDRLRVPTTVSNALLKVAEAI